MSCPKKSDNWKCWRLNETVMNCNQLKTKVQDEKIRMKNFKQRIFPPPFFATK